MRQSPRWTPPRLAPLLAAATLFFAAAPVAAQIRAAAPIVGTWSGEYICNQGLTGVTLTITRGEPRDVRALFHFYEAPSNPGVPTGCFEMAGTYDPGSGALRLEGGRWLLRPATYVVVDFIGRLSPGGRFEGRVDGPGCSTFRLARRPSPLPVPRECRPRPETVAAGESGPQTTSN